MRLVFFRVRTCRVFTGKSGVRDIWNVEGRLMGGEGRLTPDINHMQGWFVKGDQLPPTYLSPHSFTYNLKNTGTKGRGQFCE